MVRTPDYWRARAKQSVCGSFSSVYNLENSKRYHAHIICYLRLTMIGGSVLSAHSQLKPGGGPCVCGVRSCVRYSYLCVLLKPSSGPDPFGVVSVAV